VTLRILVYGLLRRGERLHGLLAGAHYVEHVRIEGYDLFDLGEYPAAVPGAGVLVAELWELAGAEALDALDLAEGAPALYRRELVRGAWLYVYAQPLRGAPKIPSGDWRSPRAPPSISRNPLCGPGSAP
jgi:gamma-glutamylcyclotransferase (GGCT)/AIG2-like uncharacterized protein YtfP